MESKNGDGRWQQINSMYTTEKGQSPHKSDAKTFLSRDQSVVEALGSISKINNSKIAQAGWQNKSARAKTT